MPEMATGKRVAHRRARLPEQENEVLRQAAEYFRQAAPSPPIAWPDRWGRVGAAGDNAAMESFFSLLQKNVLNRRSWAARKQLRIAIVTWIERTYHGRRR